MKRTRTRGDIRVRRRKRQRARPGRLAIGNAERKFKDNTASGVYASTAAFLLNLVTIAQGTDEDERIGRKVVVKSVHIRNRITLASTSTPGNTSDFVRIMLVHDKQANKAAITTTELLEVNTAVESYLNLSNKGRFKILADYKAPIISKSGAYDGTNDQFGENQKWMEFNVDNLNIPIEYSSTTGAIGEITSNNIALVAYSAAGIAGYNIRARVRYTDL